MGGDTVSDKEERRRWTRIPAEHLVSYTHFDEQMIPDDVGMARTLDLSEGGILMEVTRNLEEGSPLEIKMVSGDHTVRARGTIVHRQRLSSGRWRVGLDFTDITEGDLVAIAREVVRSQDMGGRV